jgi:hypothetical protein
VDAEDPDTTSRASLRRRVPGRNGKGVLIPFQKGQKLPAGFNTPVTARETLWLARKHSPAAMMTLIQNLQHPDARVSTMSAQLVLDRAWGRPREQEQKPEAGGTIDLSELGSDELRILMRLAQSGRIKASEGES